MLHTSLYSEHVQLGGRMIGFGSWELPVQYTGIAEEHLACRQNAGLFDVSHMGEIFVEGPSAEAYLNFLVTQDITKLAIGQALYTVMCHANAGIVDDLVIYRLAKDRFLAVVNASNTEKDYRHMLSVAGRFSSGLTLTNKSAQYSQIAIQGPQAEKILTHIIPASQKNAMQNLKTYWFLEGQLFGDLPAIIGRTGYTGEDGFELYVAWDEGPRVWRALMEAGTSEGLKACGLGARDTLRLEMKYPLYGNELTDETNPLEAGLGWVVKLGKSCDFMGKESLLKIKAEGPKKQLVGLKLRGRGIPRHNYTLHTEDGMTQIGVVTSGTQSPSLKEPIAIGYVDIAHAQVGTKLTMDIRGTKISAEVVRTPFYKRE